MHSLALLARFLITFVLVLTVSACSSTEVSEPDPRDPLEPVNRAVLAFNLTADDVILEPAARGFRTLPAFIQTSIANHLRWTSYPSTAVNSTLQGKAENAALATIHFLVNGLTLGLVDLTEADDNPASEDFGQTLAHWSVPEGPYIMMPLLGPGTTRSNIGRLVDTFTNPLGLANEPTADNIRTAGTPLGAVSFRALTFDQFNAVKSSADPYARTRAIYYQHRQGQLNDGDRSIETDADAAFDSFLNESE